jgi:hypothetical protein
VPTPPIGGINPKTGAVVLIVNVEVTELAPGVTLGGEKEHGPERGGSPEQVSEIAFGNIPPCGVIGTV